MDLVPAVGIAIVLVLLVIGVVAAVGLFLWGRRVAMWHASSRWRRAAFLPFAAPVVFIAGIAVTVVRLVLGFDVIASAEAREKAALLTQHIADAMVSTWAGIVIGGVVTLGCAVLFLIGTIRRPRGAQLEPRL